MKFPPKKPDAWAAWVFVAGLLVLIGAGAYLATLHLATGIALSVFWLLVLCLIGSGTHYEMTSSHVIVLVGPLPVWRVRLDEIVEAAPVSSISATAHFASSSEAIRIVSRRRIFGLLPPTLSISPADRSGFLSDLAAASPHLELGSDGTVRRSVAREEKT
jgi:hypothetical protein